MVRLAYDTFPRSGTAFIKHSLELAFDYEIVGGMHKIATFSKEQNVITSIRNPKDCIPSWIEFRKLSKELLPDYLDWYIRFLQGTVLNINKIYVVTFEKLTSTIELVMKEYANRFNLKSPKSITNDQVKQSMQLEYSEHLPRNKSNYRIELDELILKEPRFFEALNIYELVKSKIQ